jgi:DNA adenine methylase
MGDAVTSPALRYHGAKFRLASWVMQFFPAHRCYVEPFGGAAGVLLQKERAYAEIYNDLDGDVVNFFQVLRDQELRRQLLEAIVLTPYSRSDFEEAWEPTEDRVERARRIAVRAQMGFGSAGASKGKTGFRIDTKRAYGTAQHLWLEYPTAIATAGRRMSGVLVENRPAIEVMRQHDAADTLHFVDPPYLHATRVLGESKAGVYRHEMTDADHDDLLDALLELQGMVIVCGYPSDLYDNALKGWTMHDVEARISAGRGTAMRTECAWLNPACVAALTRRQGLFAEVANG